MRSVGFMATNKSNTLTIVTEDDLRAFQRGTLPMQHRRIIRQVIRTDEKARAYVRKLAVTPKPQPRQENNMTTLAHANSSNITPLETGIDEQKTLANALTGCLADTYLLMVKTQGCHWNVVGPQFLAIHTLTEQHYADLFTAVDDLAERIRALGYPAPTSAKSMIEASNLAEITTNLDAAEMLEVLIADHQTVATRFREAAGEADVLNDLVTADMLTTRINFHEKSIWMLKALNA